MKDYHINIFYSQEDDGYIADIPDLHYCSAFGRTPSERSRNSRKPRPPGSRRRTPRASQSRSHVIVRRFIKAPGRNSLGRVLVESTSINAGSCHSLSLRSQTFSKQMRHSGIKSSSELLNSEDSNRDRECRLETSITMSSGRP